ncbi:hypothetical protein L7F22_060922 [Adiantum nelumboides]|nr:hypothetical protein [Adiantum nelumboides]
MSASYDDQILQILELKHMEEKMFVVWDGNHRLHAWREWAYHERLDEFSMPRVECTLVALNRTEIAEFLLVLSMINKVTRVHVHTTTHDIFMMQKLGLVDFKSILDKFDNEDRAKAERVLHGTAMNHSKWLRLPMALLSQLLWKEEFDRMYQEKIQNLPARDTREYMDHEEDYEASYAMALKATESIFVRKGLEIVVIANPDNDSDFFRLCISFPSWGERGCKMTTFRVSEIACAHITSQEKCRLLGLLPSDDAALKEAEFLLDDGALVVACRAEHLFKVSSEAYKFQFCHIWTLFLRMPSHTYVMDYNFTDLVATLTVAMFVCDLDGPLPVPFYDRRAGDIAGDIDGYEADSDMLREPLRESSWTLDTSGVAFRSGVEKRKFFARWLIGTFTTVGDVVLDCLAGCGDMATECERLHRHCISIEKDVVVF